MITRRQFIQYTSAVALSGCGDDVSLGLSQSDPGTYAGGDITIDPVGPPTPPVTGFPNWPIPAFLGADHITVPTVTMNTIDVEASSGELPFLLYASAQNVTSPGATRDNGIGSVYPYTMLEHSWLLTYDDDSPISVSDGDSLTDARGGTVNPYTDYVGGEYTVPIREAGDYKLTLTSRGPDGIGGFTSNTTNTAITVTEGTYDHLFIDGAAGNEANDGFDPWGFSTSATYTESTGALTQTAAFASYDHAAAAAGNPTDWYNWIYLISDNTGALGTWHRITAKNSNNEIIISPKLGSNRTSVLSSDGPKQLFQGEDDGTLFMDTFVHLNGNQGATSYNVTSRIRLATGTYNNTTVKFFGGYNSDQTVVTADAVFGGTDELFSFRFSGFPLKGYFHNLYIDGQYNVLNTLGGNVTVGGLQVDKTNIFIDRCSQLNGLEGSTMKVSAPDYPVICGMWNCYTERYKQAAESSKHCAFFALLGIDSRIALVGCTWSVESDSDVFDHYVYPQGEHDNRLFAYNRMVNSRGTPSHALNFDIDEAPGETFRYITIVENYAEMCRFFTDASSKNNNPVTDGLIADLLVARNAFNAMPYPNDLTPEGRLCNGYNNTACVFLDNVVWGGGEEIISTNAQKDLAATDMYIARNRKYSDFVFGGLGGIFTNNNITLNGAFEVVDNITQLTYTDCRSVDMAFNFLGNSIIKDNNLYAPNDPLHCFDRNSTKQTLATFNTAAGETNTSTDPGWTDPANGDFT